MYYAISIKKALKPLKQLLIIILTAHLFAFLPPESALAESATPDSSETSASTNTVTTQRVLPNIPFKRSQSLLEHMRLFDREDEVIALETTIYTSEAPNPDTPAETQSDSFYGLYLEQESNNPQGAVLILHDSQQHGHWPAIIAPLREYLPQFGWSTLAIELADAPTRIRIPREINKSARQKENNDNAEENSDQKEDTNKDTGEQTTTDINKKLSPKIIYQQRNSNRIIAAINHLKSLNQLNLVIIGHGTGAAWVIDYIQKQDKESPKATKGLTLITIDALSSQLTPQKMHEQIKDIKAPYLDLVHPEQVRAMHLADQRLKIMARSKNTQYQQFITPSISSYQDTNSPTNRRIRGWLKNNAQGSQIKAAQQ